jgi:hypothetical protein
MKWLAMEAVVVVVAATAVAEGVVEEAAEVDFNFRLEYIRRRV